MLEAFVYYKVNSEREAEASAAALAWQARLRLQYPHLRARLLYRDHDSGRSATWMETYALDPPLDDRATFEKIRLDIEAQARETLGCFIDGDRHVEIFTPRYP